MRIYKSLPLTSNPAQDGGFGVNLVATTLTSAGQRQRANDF